MKKTHIYIIGTGTTTRLVRAPNRAQALAHVVRTTHTVTAANNEQIIAAMTKGIKVEDVKDGGTVEMFEGEGHAVAQ